MLGGAFKWLDSSPLRTNFMEPKCLDTNQLGIVLILDGKGAPKRDLVEIRHTAVVFQFWAKKYHQQRSI